MRTLNGKKYAIYLRKSRSDEANASIEDVLKRHKVILLELAEHDGHQIYENDIYEEVVSGESLFTRPEMLRLLDNVTSGVYEAVYVVDIDRLGRGGMKEQGIIFDTFRDSETKIITPRKIYNLADETDEELTEFEALIARRELKLIKRRLTRGMERVTLEGGHLANPPFGYKRAWKGKIPTLEIIPEEANFVKMAFDMYVNQGVGRSVIADTLTSLGAKPHRNGVWSRSSVARMLCNETYIGMIVRGRNKFTRKGQNGSQKFKSEKNPEEKIISTKGIHEPIISEELFYKAQEIRAGRYHPSYRKEDNLENPLSGIIVCKQCGFCLQRRKFKDNTTPYWLICTTKQCVKASRFDLVEEKFMESLHLELNKMKFLQQSGATSEEFKTLHETLNYINNELEKTQKQLDRLHDFLEQGIYDVETFRSRSSVLKDKINRLLSQQYEFEEKIKIFDTEKYDFVIAKLEKAIEAYYNPNITNLEKNQLLKEVVNKVVYYKAKDWAKGQFELYIYLKDF